MVKELSSGGDIKEALADAKHRKSGRLSLGEGGREGGRQGKI